MQQADERMEGAQALQPRTLPGVTLRTTALTEIHRSAGAKMADFGGWDMPIEYTTGVVAEHTAVRTDVGVFDVSHMGKLVLEGPGAASALNALLANDLQRISAGQAQYSMLCNDAGGVVDDLIVYRFSDDHVRIVPNAANAAAVRDALVAGLPASVALEDLRGHCLLMRESGSTTRQLTEAMLRDAGITPGPLLEIGSRESIREAVLRNIGVSIIARHEVPHSPELRVLALEGAPQIVEYLYCLKERRLARLPAAFLAVAREQA